MRKPKSVRALEDFGRIRLSRSFFMRDFLYSDIATVHRMANLPDNPDLAVAAGHELCVQLLEPLQAAFGRKINDESQTGGGGLHATSRPD